MSVREPEAPLGMDPADDVRLVLITTPNEGVGGDLARALVDARLAACVNVLPGLTSIYRWEGEVQEDSEALLIVKTSHAALGALVELVRRLHPYDVPECVALRPDVSEGRYLRWWRDQLEPRAGREGASSSEVGRTP